MRNNGPAVLVLAGLLLAAGPARAWDSQFSIGSSAIDLSGFRAVVLGHALTAAHEYGGAVQIIQNESPGAALVLRFGVEIPFHDRAGVLLGGGYWGTPGELRVQVEASGTSYYGFKDSWVLDLSGFEGQAGGYWRLLGRRDGWHLLSHVRVGYLYLAGEGTRKVNSPSVIDTATDLRGGTVTAEIGSTFGLGGRRVFLDLGWRVLARVTRPTLAGPLDFDRDGVIEIADGSPFPGTGSGGGAMDFTGFYWRIGLRF